MSRRWWSVLAGGLLGLGLSAPAEAQVFIDWNRTFDPGTVPSGMETRSSQRPLATKTPRLSLGAYATIWDFPDFSIGGGVRQQFEADLSPLLTADYNLTENLSIGGWWNPMSGTIELRRGAVSVDAADLSINFWDAHLRYDLPRAWRWARGVSVQGGYSGQSLEFTARPGFNFGAGQTTVARTEKSFNFWLNKSQQIAAPRIGDRRRPISLFASAGYYTNSDFGRWNLLVGGSIGLTERVKLGASAWFNDLEQDTVLRITAGVAAAF